jgi:hypothetical protein
MYSVQVHAFTVSIGHHLIRGKDLRDYGLCRMDMYKDEQQTVVIEKSYIFPFCSLRWHLVTRIGKKTRKIETDAFQLAQLS